MPSLPRMWPRMVSPPEDSPPSRALCSDHRRGDVLEAHRDFVALFAQSRGQAVEHMGGGQVAHHAAPLAAHFVQVPVEQHQHVVDRRCTRRSRPRWRCGRRRRPSPGPDRSCLRSIWEVSRRRASRSGAGERPPNSGLWRSWMKVTRQRASVSTVPSVSWPTPYIGSTITLQAGLADRVHVDQTSRPHPHIRW